MNTKRKTTDMEPIQKLTTALIGIFSFATVISLLVSRTENWKAWLSIVLIALVTKIAVYEQNEKK